ncbi:MAG: AMP-binding protein, partial [Planctomycetota bacterium]
RACIRPILEVLYRKRVIGMENLPSQGGCVVISNHVSWMDGILLLWMLPRNVRFIVDGGNFGGGLARYLAAAFDTILMQANPKSIGRALKEARASVGSGEIVGIFPEGAITRTGQLQAFRPGLQKILKGNDDAVVVPMWLEGMWGSIFSYSGGKFFFKKPDRLRRRVTLRIGKPLPADTPLDTLRQQVQLLGSESGIQEREQLPHLASQVVRVWRKRGGQIQAADSTGVEVSGRDLLTRSLALRRVLRREVLAKDEQHVGILLPPSVGGVATNVALALDRRISANLNYTVSNDVLNHCIHDISIKHVLTSKKFLSKLSFQPDAEVVLLDDLKDRITLADKVIAFALAVLTPAWLLDRLLGLDQVRADDILTVIFTSGSTGMPKGVLLSNANISHNVDAVRRAIRLNQSDTVLGILPFFHSFGYSVTLWAVMTLGPRGVYHFNPLDAKQVGKLTKKYGATVLLGTPTFLRGYMRRVEPDQFATLDVVVVGAEKMPADLFDAFEQKFGVRPVEGYGATELSPLVSVNIPPSRLSVSFHKNCVEGSVGRPFAGIAARVVSTDDGHELPVGEDGMLMITGPNVMQGYAGQEELTKKAITDGWYNTGDIAHVDADGFLHITGRLSRFSKIGGEMVPHVRIEEELTKLVSDANDEEIRVCVTAVPDPKKGEKLIVLLKSGRGEPEELREGLRGAGLPNLFVPAADGFYHVDEIPLLGTGKLDLKAAKDLAAKLSGERVSTSS